ncbi:ILA [Symbiodinium sp. CCMP2592]|nr:ILA [Symbiodinium sp. CCMP2592]
MPVIRDKIESSGLLDGWRKVKTFSCVDIASQEVSSESAYKQLDGKATEFLKPGERLDPECGVETLTFESYKSCRGRGQIDFKLFQRVARELPPEYTPEIKSLRLQKLSYDIAQLPILLPDILEMFDSSISLELCLWSSVPWLKMPEVHGLNTSDICRRGANKLLPELWKGLGDSAESRLALARVFQEAPEAVLPELRKALGDSDAFVRRNAADLLKSAGKRARAAVPELQKNLGAPFVALRAQEALAAIGKEAPETLTAIGKEAPDAVLPELQKALGATLMIVLSGGANSKDGKQTLQAVLPELRKALNDSDSDVRRSVVEAMGSIGQVSPETALPELQKALGDSDSEVRSHAAGALGSVGRFGKEVPTAAVQDLRKALSDSDSAVRRSATDALRYIGKPARAAVPELQKALGDSDSEVRSHAAGALGSFGRWARAAVPELRKALGDSGYSVRQNAAEALGIIAAEAPETVLPELGKAFGDADSVVREAAEKALRSLSRRAQTRESGKAAAEPALEKVVAAISSLDGQPVVESTAPTVTEDPVLKSLEDGVGAQDPALEQSRGAVPDASTPTVTEDPVLKALEDGVGAQDPAFGQNRRAVPDVSTPTVTEDPVLKSLEDGVGAQDPTFNQNRSTSAEHKRGLAPNRSVAMDSQEKGKSRSNVSAVDTVVAAMSAEGGNEGPVAVDLAAPTLTDPVRS